MTREQLKAFLDLMMVSDPWPLDADEDTILKDFADEQARAYGFENWIVAFHEL